ncbi:MAG: hypothetical protein AAFY56_18250 [Pseudomonadota bacterium]
MRAKEFHGRVFLSSVRIGITPDVCANIRMVHRKEVTGVIATSIKNDRTTPYFRYGVDNEIWKSSDIAFIRKTKLGFLYFLAVFVKSVFRGKAKNYPHIVRVKVM